MGPAPEIIVHSVKVQADSVDHGNFDSWPLAVVGALEIMKSAGDALGIGRDRVSGQDLKGTESIKKIRPDTLAL